MVEDDRCTVVEMSSYRATWILLRCGVVFAQHSLWLDFAKAKFKMRNFKSRVIVNLWHGIPIKNLAHNNTGIRSDQGLREMPHYLIPCSSDLDLRSMKMAFCSTPLKNFWVTGIPRNDFLCCDENQLPITYRDQLAQLRDRLDGRRLVLYAPTYRETPSGGKYLEFSAQQLHKLEKILQKHSAVLGVRFHSYRPPDNQLGLMNSNEVLDLSGRVVDDVRLLVRASDILISDYSSIGLDALYAGIPVICFAYDLTHYQEQQRGFFYDLKRVFGADIACEFSELENKLETYLSSEYANAHNDSTEQLQFRSQIFLHRDDKNGERFAERLLDHVQATFGQLNS